MPVVVGAFAVQILIVNVIPGATTTSTRRSTSRPTRSSAWRWSANLRTPGMPLIALGGLSNALAIVANSGVMPASEGALRLAGMTADPEAFTNSGLVRDAHLAFLGDVFAVPAWVPAANVFSVGDLLLVAGGWVLMHRVCGTRAPWRRMLDRGPGVVLFGAGGAVEAATPQAVRMLGALNGGAVRQRRRDRPPARGLHRRRPRPRERRAASTPRSPRRGSSTAADACSPSPPRASTPPTRRGRGVAVVCARA